MRQWVLGFCLLLGLASATFAAPAAVNITVLLDERLMLAGSDLARLYAQQEGRSLTIARTQPDRLAEAVGQGLEAHLIITADDALIRQLKAQGLVDIASIQALVETPVALVTTQRLNAQQSFAQYISVAALLYATPALPLYFPTDMSAHTMELVKALEFPDRLRDRLQEKPTSAEVIEMLEKYDGIALLPVSDMKLYPRLALLQQLPVHLMPPLRYHVMVLASEYSSQAHQLIKFLRSAPAQEKLAAFGFTLVH